MAKFQSIWGEFDVREENISPAPDAAASAEPAAKPTPKADTAEEEEEEEYDGESSSSNTATQPQVTPGKSTPSAKEEGAEEEEYDFSEDDVSKAYTMLEEEGVLEIGEDDDFEMSPKGLADAVAATVRNKMAAQIEAIPPTVQEYYAHIMEGKSPESFKPSAPIKWAEYNSSSDESKKVALREFYRRQGMAEDDIDEEIEDAEVSGKLEKKANMAIDSLEAQQAEEEAAQAAANAKAKADAEKARQADIDELKGIIDKSTEIAGFELNDDKRKAFKDYLFNVNPRTGKTQMQENMADENRRMTIAFLDFVNYSKADLTKEISSTLTKDRKKKLAKFTDKNAANTNSSAVVKTKAQNKGSIVFPSIFGTHKIEIED